jgi:stage II sporulation protein M
MIQFYQAQFKYFKEMHMKFFLFVLGVFFVFNLISYLGIINHPEEVANAKSSIIDMLGGTEKLKDIKESEQKTLLHYLKNNVSLLIILFLAGIAPLYLVPALIFMPNAILLGVVMGISKIERDSAFSEALTTIGPHGITEFTSIFTATALSLHLSHTVTRKIFSKRRKEISFKNNLLKATTFFLTISVPLMVLSAFIETYITPVISQYFQG